MDARTSPAAPWRRRAVASAAALLLLAPALARPAAAAGPAPLAPDPDAARSVAALGRAALDAHRPADAAALFDRAAALDPHPLWLLAAGDAWLAAAAPDAAISRLTAALAAADPPLAPAARADAAARLALARRLAPHVAAARAAEADADWDSATTAWEEAFRTAPLGRLALAAAAAAERAGEPATAERLYAAAAERHDLPDPDARAIASARARLGARPTPPAAAAAPAPDTTAPWVLVAAGGAAVIAGAICLAVAEGYDADLRALKDSATDGVVTGTPREDAVALHDRAQTWTTAGWITAASGALTAAVGVGWLLAASSADDRARLDVRAALTPGGLTLSARGAF